LIDHADIMDVRGAEKQPALVIATKGHAQGIIAELRARRFAYASAGFVENADVKDICRQHTHLVEADGTPRVSNVDTLLVG
jgi:hypothetical protein